MNLFRSRKTKSAFALLFVIAAIVFTSEVGGYYYLQSIFMKNSLSHGSSGSSGTGPIKNPNTITVDTLINYGNGTSMWYNESDVAIGSNFYSLTFRITNGNLNASYSQIYDSHFITGINGVKSNGIGTNCSYCWGIWVYCAKDIAWSYSLLGVDLIKLNNGEVLAWYIQNISQNQPPEQGAKTVAMCSS